MPQKNRPPEARKSDDAPSSEASSLPPGLYEVAVLIGNAGVQQLTRGGAEDPELMIEAARALLETAQEAAEITHRVVLHQIERLEDVVEEQLGVGRVDDPDRIARVLAEGAMIEDQDILYEQLAHRFAYRDPDPKALSAWGYRYLDEVAHAESGFRVVAFVPLDDAGCQRGGSRPLRPVLAFRGTDNPEGLIDDGNAEGIGAYQFAYNEAAIVALLARAAATSDEQVDLVGHSLGGALAQMTAARHPGEIGRLVTFQSPSVGARDAAAVSEWNAGCPPEDQIASTHYRATADVVPLGGEALTEGEIRRLDYVGLETPLSHMSYPLAQLDADRGYSLPKIAAGDAPVAQSQLRSVWSFGTDQDAPPLDALGEPVRLEAGRLYDECVPGQSQPVTLLGMDTGLETRDLMTPAQRLQEMVCSPDEAPGNRFLGDDYARTWAAVQRAAREGASAEQIDALIRDAPALTAPQRKNMRDSVRQLHSRLGG